MPKPRRLAKRLAKVRPQVSPEKRAAQRAMLSLKAERTPQSLINFLEKKKATYPKTRVPKSLGFAIKQVNKYIELQKRMPTKYPKATKISLGKILRQLEPKAGTKLEQILRGRAEREIIRQQKIRDKSNIRQTKLKNVLHQWNLNASGRALLKTVFLKNVEALSKEKTPIKKILKLNSIKTNLAYLPYKGTKKLQREVTALISLYEQLQKTKNSTVKRKLEDKIDKRTRNLKKATIDFKYKYRYKV